MKAAMRMLLTASIALGACVMISPAPAAAQSTVQKVETGVSKAAKTTKHNVVKTSKKIGYGTKKAAKSTYRATSNLVNGHRILCSDGTWASRDNPTCSDHGSVASRQPGEKDKH